MKTELIIPSYDRVAILMQTIGQVRQLYPELDISALAFKASRPPVNSSIDF